MYDRSSHQRCSMKKGVLRNFAKFTGKHLCQSLFLNKVAGLRSLLQKNLWHPATLLKKRLWHRCFPVNFAKLLRTPFFIEHVWWLLLVCWSMICNKVLMILCQSFNVTKALMYLGPNHFLFMQFFYSKTLIARRIA